MATTSPDNIWSPDSGDDYALTVDLAAMADTVQDAFTDIRTNTLSTGGTTANRPAAGLEGRTYYATDTNIQWLDTGTEWVVWNTRIRGRVTRSSTATVFDPVYTNVGANTFWTPDVAVGLEAYDGGWTVPISGRYLIGYEIRSTGAFLAGLTVNYSGSSPTLFGASTSSAVQNVATTTVSLTRKLAAGDKIRPYLLAATGTPSWIVGVGFFSVEWIGND